MLYIDHARQQMNARGISEDDVERTAVQAYYVGICPHGRRAYVRRYGNRGMRFVVHLDANADIVVTVRKQSRPYMGV
jgi:hypothetical protein